MSHIDGAAGSTCPPTVTLVLCTRNRAQLLDACLDAIDGARRPGTDVVLVDNGSDDDTYERLSEYHRARDGVLVVVEPRPGLGRARNAGLAHARGDYIAFVDDDCYLEPTFVDDLCAEFEAHPTAAFVAGRVLLHDPADLPITICESEQYEHFPSRSYLRAGAVHGANLSFRTSMLEAIGGFDPRMGAGTPFPAEDVDAAGRLLWAGHTGLYSPAPTVRHHHRRRSEHDAIRIMRAYDDGRGAYFAKFIADDRSRMTYLRAFVRHAVGDVLRSGRHTCVPRELRAAARWYRSTRRGPS